MLNGNLSILVETCSHSLPPCLVFEISKVEDITFSTKSELDENRFVVVGLLNLWKQKKYTHILCNSLIDYKTMLKTLLWILYHCFRSWPTWLAHFRNNTACNWHVILLDQSSIAMGYVIHSLSFHVVYLKYSVQSDTYLRFLLRNEWQETSCS